LLRFERQRRTLASFASNRLEQVNLHIPPVVGKQAHQVRQQIIIANERRQGVELTITQVTNRHWLQLHL